MPILNTAELTQAKNSDFDLDIRITIVDSQETSEQPETSATSFCTYTNTFCISGPTGSWC